MEPDSKLNILGYSLDQHSASLPELGDGLFDVRDTDRKSKYGGRRCTS